MEKRFRYEWKYLISYPEYEALKVRMAPYFKLDSHATDGEYLIRSLYFDDYWNSAYEEKDMGVFFRKKYRIRIYDHVGYFQHIQIRTDVIEKVPSL